MSERNDRTRALLLALKDIGVPQIPSLHQCDDDCIDDPRRCIEEYLRDGRGEPTEIAGSICNYIRRSHLEKVLRSRHISLSNYMHDYSEDERCLSFINGDATWPWDSADLLADTLIAEKEARKKKLVEVGDADRGASRDWKYSLERMKDLFLDNGRHLGKCVTLEGMIRMVTERRERNQLFVAEVTQLGFPPSNVDDWIENAPGTVVQYVEKGRGTLIEAVQAWRDHIRKAEMNSALTSVDRSLSYIIRKNARCRDFEQGLLGETTAQEVIESVKADYDNRKQRLEAHLNTANVTHAYLERDYLEGQCSWDKFLHVQVTADRRQLVNAAMRRTLPLASSLDNDPRISKYVESGEGYVDADALVAELLDERNQRVALISITFAASKTPEPQGPKDRGWQKVQLFVNSGQGDLAAIVAGTQLELLKDVTLANCQLAAELLASSHADDFKTVLAQSIATRKEREQSLEAKLRKNGLPQSLSRALLAMLVTDNYASIISSFSLSAEEHTGFAACFSAAEKARFLIALSAKEREAFLAAMSEGEKAAFFAQIDHSDAESFLSMLSPDKRASFLMAVENAEYLKARALKLAAMSDKKQEAFLKAEEEDANMLAYQAGLLAKVQAYIAGGVDNSFEVAFFQHIAAWTRYKHLEKLLESHNLPADVLICERGGYSSNSHSHGLDSLLGISAGKIWKSYRFNMMNLFQPTKCGEDTSVLARYGAEKLSLDTLNVLLPNIYKGDPRCVAYVHGTSAWEDAEPLAATLVSERLERQQKMEVALPKTMREPDDDKRCVAFIDLGVGTVEAVVHEIRARRQRRQDLDAELRRLNLGSNLSNTWRLSWFGLEKEWLGKDHAYVVFGMGTLSDTVASFEGVGSKQKRERALKLALESQGLVVEVALLDDRCTAFLEGNPNTTAEEISATLLEERRSRLNDLQKALAVLGCPDVGMSSVFYSNEDDCYGYQDQDNDDLPSWSCEECSAKERFEFIEKAEGSADSVAATMAEYHRGSALLRVLRKCGCPAWVGSESFPDALVQWAGENKSCNRFVTGRLTGMTVDDFVQGLVSEEQADPHGEAWQEPYGPDHSDYGGGNEWKYHLSGGDYGNDPDQDAMWDGYWDS
jgi:hypothetical protein